MISAIQPNLQCTNKKYNQTSFGSIHPTRCFVKWDDGYYYQATEKEVIKDLKRLIVSLLNKNINNERRGVQPLAKPTKAWIKKNALVERISKFFTNRDADYARHNEVRAFSRLNDNHKPEIFILTGKHIFIADDEGKNVGRIYRKSKEKAEVVSDNLGIPFEDAKKSVDMEFEHDLKLAKMNYFDKVEAQIKQILSVPNPSNTPFDAYFVAKKKGDKFVYELVDAKLNGK